MTYDSWKTTEPEPDYVPDEEPPCDSFCRNCGDRLTEDAYRAASRLPYTNWRPCPNPSPGREMVDCGVGGHMYEERPAPPDPMLSVLCHVDDVVIACNRLGLHATITLRITSPDGSVVTVTKESEMARRGTT